MGFEDRHYYRDNPTRGGTGLMWLLTGSVPLFTVFGIRVRLHATMILYIAITLLFSGGANGIGPKNAIVSMTILFGSVLLHEFGHCFGARWMGGQADDILMWPLGGLALASPPHRPWPSMVTTAMGPMVNLVICVVTGVALAVMNNSAGAIPWFPLRDGLRTYVPHDTFSYYLWWIFLVNYALLCFNLLLVFYPFDGGRLVQEALWFKLGYYKSMRIATTIGMVGAVVIGVIGLAFFSLNLILIGIFGFYTCHRQRQALREAGPYEEDAIDYSAAYDNNIGQPKRKSNWQTKRASKRAVQQADVERREQETIDAILAKVSAQGMNSLNWMEKRALKKATERQRLAEELRVKRAYR